MRQFIIAFLLGCAACGPVQAAERHADSTALHEFTGQYVLQDGRVLTVSQRHRTLTAQIEGQPSAPLEATAPATFATPGGELILVFDQRSNGNVAGLTVTQTTHPVRQARR